MSTGEIRAVNRAPRMRRAWFDVAVPRRTLEPVPEDAPRYATFRHAAGGNPWPAVRGADIGHVATLYHVQGWFPPGATVEGAIAPAERWSEPWTYAPSEWVRGKMAAMVPRVVAVTDGVRRELRSPKVLQRAGNAAVENWMAYGRIEGTPLYCEMYLRVYALSDVVELEVVVGHSDPRSDALEWELDSLSLCTGELLWLDHGPRWSRPGPQWDPTAEAWVQHLLPRGGTVIGDGQQIQAWGALLCLGREASLARVVLGHDDPRIESLRARIEGGRIDAVATTWEGRWLAFGAVPCGRGDDDAERHDAQLAAAYAWLRTPGGCWWDARPRGLRKDTASTDDQQDFGACSGTELVTWHDPTFLEPLRAMLDDPCRPTHLREVELGRPNTDRRPQWRTWGQLTHFDAAVSPDRFGKPSMRRRAPHGWGPKYPEDQSANNLHMLYAVTGAPMLADLIDDEIALELAHHPRTVWTPASFGRRLLANTNRYLLRGRTDVWELVLRDVGIVWDHPWLGAQFLGDDERQMRPLAVDPADWAVIADHAIAALGLIAAHRVATMRWRRQGETDEPGVRGLLAEVCAFVVRVGWFCEAGVWQLADAVRYDRSLEGVVPELRHYLGGGTPDVVRIDDAKKLDQVVPVVLWIDHEARSAEFVGEEPMLPADVVGRARVIARQVVDANGSCPSDPADREWWAVCGGWGAVEKHREGRA